MEYERILLPVAGDGDVDPVVDHASSLAAALGAELLALHVVDPDGAGGETAGETREPEAVFDAVAERVDDTVPLERVTAEGEPGESIVDAVHDWECEFVVMGTHNRQGIDRLVTGSVAEHVTRTAGVPVTTIAVDD